MRTPLASLIGIAIVAGSIQLARADAPPEPPARYHTSMLVGDLSWVGAGALALSTKSAGLGFVALGGYVLGGPIAHLVEDEPRHAATSFGLRLGLPALGAAIGWAVSPEGCWVDYDPGVCDVDGELAAAVIGAGVGGLAALVVDHAFLSRHSPRQPGWQPTVAAGPHGATFGVAGRF